MSIHEGDMRPWLGRRNDRMVDVGSRGAGEIAGLAKSEIFAFDADDNNSGFTTTMKFARRPSGSEDRPDRKSSKQTSEQKGHAGSREKTTTSFLKIYHDERLGWTGKPEADIVMACIE
jgi:hypothetical protein